MAKFAVLHDVSGATSEPIGLAVERTDDVLIVGVPEEYGLPHSIGGEYRVLQPDMTRVVYRPGDVGYLEQVLADLSWAFAIGEQGEVERADRGTLLELMTEHVYNPRHEELVGEYVVVGETSQALYCRIDGGTHHQHADAGEAEPEDPTRSGEEADAPVDRLSLSVAA